MLLFLSNIASGVPVSFFIVSSAVEQGQCISEKIITFTAVFTVHPFKVKSRYVSARAAVSLSVPSARYAIIIIGITVSFAGKPRIKAIRITPSSPINLPIGSSAAEQTESMLSPPIYTFAASHIISPAGAATAAALPKTNSVRSKIDRTITLPICGLL